MEDTTKVQVADALATAAEELAAPAPPETFKEKFMRYFGALLFEKKDKKWVISIGRISWWLAFSPALVVWIDNVGKPVADQMDITAHHLTVLLLLAGYNFGKKVTEAIAKKSAASDGPG